MTFNVAPDPITKQEFDVVLHAILDGAQGLGMLLASLPNENGWDQANFFDHDLGDELMSTALANMKHWAAGANKFYNTSKLEDAISQALVEAYSRGFLYVKDLMA